MKYDYFIECQPMSQMLCFEFLLTEPTLNVFCNFNKHILIKDENRPIKDQKLELLSL